MRLTAGVILCCMFLTSRIAVGGDVHSSCPTKPPSQCIAKPADAGVTITISKDGTGKTTVDCDCAWVGEGQSVTFTSGSSSFAAVFENVHPFKNNHRLFVRSSASAQTKRPSANGSGYAYDACYDTAHSENCIDPKVIVNPTSAILDLATLAVSLPTDRSRETQEVTVRNASSVSLTISSIGLITNALRVPGGDGECKVGTTLQPGGTCSVAIRVAKPGETATVVVTYRDVLSGITSSQAIVFTAQ